MKPIRESVFLMVLMAAFLLAPPSTIGQPTTTTNAATNISSTSAKLNGSVLSPALPATAHFDWGTTMLYGNVTPDVIVSEASTPQPIMFTLTGLVPNSTYHFRASASNDNGSSNGSDMSFVTTAAAPTVATSSAQNVTSSSARLVGTANPRNSATNAHFEWGTSIAYGNTTPNSSLTADTTTQTVMFDLGSLSPNMTYHYRITATNPGGTSNGGDQTFTTAPLAPLPTVTVLQLQDLTPNSARFVGAVNPNGASTTAHFEWGPTSLYGNTTPDVSMGNGTSDVQISFALGGLSPHSTYHYRLVATNIGGTANSGDQVFATTSIGPSLVPLLTPWGGILLASLFLIGFISSILVQRRVKSRR